MTGEMTARNGDSTMTSGTSGQLPLPAGAQRVGHVQVVGHVDGPDVAGDQAPEVDRLDDRAVDPVDRDDDPLLAMRPGQDALVADVELRLLAARTGGG